MAGTFSYFRQLHRTLLARLLPDARAIKIEHAHSHSHQKFTKALARGSGSKNKSQICIFITCRTEVCGFLRMFFTARPDTVIS